MNIEMILYAAIFALILAPFYLPKFKILKPKHMTYRIIKIEEGKRIWYTIEQRILWIFWRNIFNPQPWNNKKESIEECVEFIESIQEKRTIVKTITF